MISEGRDSVRCPVYVELERRTNPSRLSSKIERYCGHYLRILRDDARCVIRPVLVVHHDARSDRWRRHTPGSGAEALRSRVAGELRSSAVHAAHYRALDELLMQVDRTLDAGRLFVLADWRDLRDLDFSAPLYPVSGYPSEAETTEGGGGGYDWRVDFKQMIDEWKWTTDAVTKRLREGWN